MAKTVPLCFKVTLIKSVLIPRASYGIDIYGFKYSNVNGIWKLVNLGIKLATNNKNICISAAYEEFKIDPIELTGRYMALKNIDQNPENESIIKSIQDNRKYIQLKGGGRKEQECWN